MWKILRVIWWRGGVADQWKCAEGVSIPKEENSIDIDQLRTISLLSTEGNIFFSIWSQQLSSFPSENDDIITSVQKGFLWNTWLLAAYRGFHSVIERFKGRKGRPGPLVGSH